MAIITCPKCGATAEVVRLSENQHGRNYNLIEFAARCQVLEDDIGEGSKCGVLEKAIEEAIKSGCV